MTPYIVLIVVAVVVITGIVIYKKKNKFTFLTIINDNHKKWIY